jgi:hypothetical protein
MRKHITWAPPVNGRHAGGSGSENGTPETAALRPAG